MPTLTFSHHIVDIVVLLVRVVIGVAFLTESYIKAKDIKKFAKSDGLPIPVARFVTLCEFMAAVSMISGVLSQFAAIGIMILMSLTMSMQIFKWHSPYRSAKAGWEYDLTLFTLASVILVFGAGAFSLFN